MSFLEQVKKKYGNGAIANINENPEQLESISTTCLSLDKAIGIGGFPKGRIVEIYGLESTGKSTLCAHVISEAQKEKGVCLYIDFEHAVDIGYFNKLGVVTDSESGQFLLSQPSSAEEGMDILELALESKEVTVIVVDSVAAMATQAELDGEVEDSTIALVARLMSKMMRRITATVAKCNTLVLFVNQLRDNIGVMGYGPKSTTTGGKALKFYSAVRVELSKIAQVKDGETIIGNTIKAKIIKNKVASPFKEAQYDIIYGEGISQENDLLQLGVKHNLVTKKGAWYYYNDEKNTVLGQGQERARKFLKENTEIKEELFNKLCQL